MNDSNDPNNLMETSTNNPGGRKDQDRLNRTMIYPSDPSDCDRKDCSQRSKRLYGNLEYLEVSGCHFSMHNEFLACRMLFGIGTALLIDTC